MVEANRKGNWMIYSLPGKCEPQLAANLKCLQDCTQTDPVFKGDLQALRKFAEKAEQSERRAVDHTLNPGAM